MSAQSLYSWYHRITQIQQGLTTLRNPIAVQLSQTVIRFGRKAPNTDVFLTDDQVSRAHATITPTSITGRYKLSDDESKNGTFVNGVRLTRPYLLEDGDVIRMGNSLFVYESIRGAETDFSKCPAGYSLHGYATNVQADRSAQLDRPILLLSQMGTYRTIMAHRIHDRSARPGRFLAINCSEHPNLSRALLGYKSHPGLLTQATGGTLFIEEASQIPLNQFQQLLNQANTNLDVRFILAAHPSEVEMKVSSALGHTAFTDEYALSIQIPSLVQRRVEILQSLLSITKTRQNISAAAAEMLLVHHWSSNHLELERFAAKLDNETNGTGNITLTDLLPQMKKMLPDPYATNALLGRFWRYF